MQIFPLQSNTMSGIDNWVCPIAHAALSGHFKMSTTKIILNHFKTHWFFSTITVSHEQCFVCNREKKSLLRIAQKEMYLNLQSLLCILHWYLCLAHTKTHWVLWKTAKKKGSTAFILRFGWEMNRVRENEMEGYFPYSSQPSQYFQIKFHYFLYFLFGIMRKILLHIWPYLPLDN